MKKKENNLLVAASGTGGHIFPALTISDLIKDDWNITWLGIKNRCEIELVPDNYKLITLDINSPREKNIFLIIQYLKILLQVFNILEIINKKRISLVFTTGGYISAPTIIAAKIMNIPIILHESNIVPGLVTNYFGRYCDYVLIGFKETKNYLKRCKCIFTGTPLRSQFYTENNLPQWVPLGEGPLLLIMGGSQGARGINQIIEESLEFLIKNNFRLVHIVGDDMSSRFTKLRNYIQVKFTTEIAALIQNCDLVISRAGSGAINEIIQSKKPSILIPYPNSKNNHQEKNALVIVSNGGGILINQNLNSKYYLKQTLKRIFGIDTKNKKKNLKILDLMKNNISQLNSKDSRYEIIEIINSYKNDL